MSDELRCSSTLSFTSTSQKYHQATNKKVFTLRLSDEVFDKIGILATSEHRSLTNYIEYVLIQHLEKVEKEHGIIITDQTKD